MYVYMRMSMPLCTHAHTRTHTHIHTHTRHTSILRALAHTTHSYAFALCCTHQTKLSRVCHVFQIGVIKYGKVLPPEKMKPVMRAPDLEATFRPKDLIAKIEVSTTPLCMTPFCMTPCQVTQHGVTETGVCLLPLSKTWRRDVKVADLDDDSYIVFSRLQILPLKPPEGELTITTESRLRPGLGFADGRFYDVETGQYMSISEAIERGLIFIDWETGMVTNKYTGEVRRGGGAECIGEVCGAGYTGEVCGVGTPERCVGGEKYIGEVCGAGYTGEV